MVQGPISVEFLESEVALRSQVYMLVHLDFPEIRGPISLPKLATFWGPKTRVRSRANLTRSNVLCIWESHIDTQ